MSQLMSMECNLWTTSSFLEFPNEARLISEDIDAEHDTLTKLACNSVSYPACSSFAALSGNSDLEHPIHRAADFQDVEEDSDDDKDVYEEEDDTSSDNNEACHSTDDEDIEFDSDTESDESEDDGDMLEHREPIDHLLKVTIFQF